MEVILNKCYGGFGVSEEGYDLYAKKKGIEIFRYGISKDCAYSQNYNPNDSFYYHFTKYFGDRLYKGNLDWDYYLDLDVSYRRDPILIEVVKELGDNVNTRFSNLTIVDIPDDLDYVIEDYDGIETLHERVRVW